MRKELKQKKSRTKLPEEIILGNKIGTRWLEENAGNGGVKQDCKAAEAAA